MYEFKKLPFGLCGAGSTFQRAMSEMLVDHKNSSAYIDDILTHSKSFDQHLEELEKIFICLRKENLKVITKKCRISFQETKFLGFVISKDGLKADPDKVQSVKEYPRPQRPKDIKKFLGLASYYRKFIKNFAVIAEPLNNLTRKAVKFEWTTKCEEALNKLKDALISPPVLIFPDFSKKFTITTDASIVGLGAVLSQA